MKAATLEPAFKSIFKQDNLKTKQWQSEDSLIGCYTPNILKAGLKQIFGTTSNRSQI